MFCNLLHVGVTGIQIATNEVGKSKMLKHVPKDLEIN